jgi:hypothetical protein
VSFRLVLAEEGALTAYALEGVRAGDDGSPFAATRLTVSETFTLEPTDADPDELDWLEQAHHETDAETGG